MFTGKIEWAGYRQSGDCSLRVFDASDVDDGDWECQVTASTFSAHDALTSNIARLVVRGNFCKRCMEILSIFAYFLVRPQPPRLEIGGAQVIRNHNFTVKEGIPDLIKCVSRYGNPAADIKWFLGKKR